MLLLCRCRVATMSPPRCSHDASTSLPSRCRGAMASLPGRDAVAMSPGTARAQVPLRQSARGARPAPGPWAALGAEARAAHGQRGALSPERCRGGRALGRCVGPGGRAGGRMSGRACGVCLHPARSVVVCRHVCLERTDAARASRFAPCTCRCACVPLRVCRLAHPPACFFACPRCPPIRFFACLPACLALAYLHDRASELDLCLCQCLCQCLCLHASLARRPISPALELRAPIDARARRANCRGVVLARGARESSDPQTYDSELIAPSDAQLPGRLLLNVWRRRAEA